jgi:hypothetical protein
LDEVSNALNGDDNLCGQRLNKFAIEKGYHDAE